MFYKVHSGQEVDFVVEVKKEHCDQYQKLFSSKLNIPKRGKRMGE